MTSIDRAARELQIAAFLKSAGWGAAERGLLAGDASFTFANLLTEAV